MTKFTTFGAIINEFYGILQGGTTIIERKISIPPDQDKFSDN